MDEIHAAIEHEIEKIKETLEKENKISIWEVKKIDYAIIYELQNLEDNSREIVNLYCNGKKNKFTFSPKQNSKKILTNIVSEIFEKRDSISINDKESGINKDKKDDNENKKQILRKYYDILKKYENDDLDFIEFAQKLADCIEDERKKEYLIKNRYKFEILEEEYKILIT